MAYNSKCTFILPIMKLTPLKLQTYHLRWQHIHALVLLEEVSMFLLHLLALSKQQAWHRPRTQVKKKKKSFIQF